MESIGCIAFFLVLLIVPIVILDQQRKQKERARAEYYAALELLKQSPTDPQLHQAALELGRDYSRCTRKGNVALYDEVALMNDINAACAGAGKAGVQVVVGSAASSLTERLEKLESLRQRGLVTQEEYSTKRAKLLDEI